MIAAGCSRQPPGAKAVADYDPVTHRLRKLETDLDHDGKLDSVSYMDGTKFLRIEIDRDENGKVDRWEFYKPDGATLDYVGLASRNDGVMDSKSFYGPGGVLQRIEISTKRDGTFDRTEFYETVDGKSVLVKSQDDVDGDGKPDKWDYYQARANHPANEPAYGITSTEFDDTHSGRAQRRFVYGPTGNIARVEVDPQGTGAWMPMKPAPGASAARVARNNGSRTPESGSRQRVSP